MLLKMAVDIFPIKMVTVHIYLSLPRVKILRKQGGDVFQLDYRIDYSTVYWFRFDL